MGPHGIQSAPLTWPEALVIGLFLLVFCSLVFGGADE
jgi:hypothetical protein